MIRLEQIAEAEDDVAHAVQMQPDHVYTRARQGELALARGQFAEALSHLEYVAEHDDSINWQFELALAKFANGDLTGAQAIIATSQERADEDDLKDAARWLNRILKLKPESTSMVEQLGLREA